MGKRAFKGHVPGQAPVPKRAEFPCGKKRPQPVEPNAKIMAARATLGLSAGSTVGPIAFAYGQGWLAGQQVLMADVYASAYRHAGLHSPGMSSSRDQSFATGAAAHLRREWQELSDEEVHKLKFGVDFTSYEINKIWDSAFRPGGGGGGGEGGASSSAMRRWKAFASAMNQAERDEVDRVVLHDLFPLWMLDRRRGQQNPLSEAKRTLLISGLKKVSRAFEEFRRQATANDHHGNDNGR